MKIRHVEMEGQAARFVVAGSGEALVLVHGLAGSLRWWSRLLGPLAAHRRVFAVDLPRPTRVLPPAHLSLWLARWFDAVGLEQADVVGHSLGGTVAARLALSRPDVARRLVLVAPAGIPCGRGLLQRVLGVAGALYDLRDDLALIAGDALRARPLGLARAVAFVSRCDLRDELGAVRTPTLLVWGARDRVVPNGVAEEWHRLIPRSRIVSVPGGHVPILEAPREVAESILTFLDEKAEDDIGDEIGPRVVDSMRLARNDDQSTAR